jgi:hypothetical protein
MLGNHGIAGGKGHVVMVLTAYFLFSSQHSAVSIQHSANPKEGGIH